MYGYIYLTTNLIDGRLYVGQHKSSSFDTTYLGSGKILKLAIAKYGKENFKTEILCECATKEDLNHKEAFYTKKFNAVSSKKFYNLKEGGEGGSSAGNRYMTNGEVFKKVPLSESEEMQKKGFWFQGPTPSQESVSRRANSNRGKKHPTAGDKISKALTGRKFTEEHKQKLRSARLGKPSLVKVPVRCIETGEVYPSLKEATIACGYRSSGNLCSHLKHNREHAFGYHWEYVT